MKKITTSLIALLMVFTGLTLNAQELPAPSPYAEVMQRVGLTDVTVKYSRPGVKGRTIFGDMLSYGKVWRTGANASTKIEFSTDVTIVGNEVKAGTYAILTIPGKDAWKVILNSNLKVTENSYDAADNVAEFSVNPQETDNVESMTFHFANVMTNSVDLVFAWETTSWSVTIEVDAKELAMKNIESKLNEIENAYGVYNNIARFYLDNEMDLDKALEMSKKSVSIKEVFWNVYTLSLIQKAKGDTKGALASAKKSLKIAEEQKYEPYIKMNKANIEEWSKK